MIKWPLLIQSNIAFCQILKVELVWFGDYCDLDSFAGSGTFTEQMFHVW